MNEWGALTRGYFIFLFFWLSKHKFQQPGMLIVHHLERSRSHRILWLLEELQIPYEMVVYKRDPTTQLAPPEMKRVHPLGKSPIVTDDDLVLAESGAIIEHLVERYGGGRFAPPIGAPERVRYSFWMHFAEGSVMPPLTLNLVMRILPTKVPFYVRPIARSISDGVLKDVLQPQHRNQFGFIESELARAPFLLGTEFSAADIQMTYPLVVAATRVDMTPYPGIRAFVERMKARPAYQRAIEKGGPVELF
jgi:glutathione S-transferase